MIPPIKNRSSLIIAAVFFTATLFAAIFVWRTGFYIGNHLHFTLFDDAMISMRYARNLANGYGLVWNPGNIPVEGFTNLAWTLIMSVIHLITDDGSIACFLVMLLSFLLVLICGWCGHLMVRTMPINKPIFASVSATALIVLSYPLMYWSLRGMEVAALAAPLMIALLIMLMGQITPYKLFVATLSLIIAVSMRPDAAVPVAAIIFFTLFRQDIPLASRIKIATLAGFTVGITMLAIAWWRYSTYIDIAPNTYYLKMTGTSVVLRLKTGMLAFMRLAIYNLWFVILIFFFSLSSLRKYSRSVFSLLGIFGIVCVYSVYVGGDAWEGFRFPNRYISVCLPLLLVASVVIVDRVITLRMSRNIFITSAVIALGYVVMLAIRSSSHPVYFGRYSLELLAGIVTFILVGLFSGIGLVACHKQRHFTAKVIIVATVWISMNGAAVLEWCAGNAHGLEGDVAATTMSYQVKEATYSNATVLVTWAGATGYYIDRQMIDLLGKCDSTVARMKSKTIGFRPGHTKWDYDHSVFNLKPDIILQTWYLDLDTHNKILSNGYIMLKNGIYVLNDTTNVNLTMLASVRPRIMLHWGSEVHYK